MLGHVQQEVVGWTDRPIHSGQVHKEWRQEQGNPRPHCGRSHMGMEGLDATGQAIRHASRGGLLILVTSKAAELTRL